MIDLKEGAKIKGIVSDYSKLGINIELENNVKGLLFHSEVFKDYEIGEKVELFIKKVRPDGKVDLTSKWGGYKENIDSNSEKILTLLKSSNNFLPFNDKSDPNEIRDVFEMSK